MKRILLYPAAATDLDNQAAFLAMDNPVTAICFYIAAEKTFNDLAEQPRMGRKRKFRNSRLEGLRSWRIKEFPKHLIFYRPIDDGIEIVRVLHGMRDLDEIFDDADS